MSPPLCLESEPQPDVTRSIKFMHIPYQSTVQYHPQVLSLPSFQYKRLQHISGSVILLVALLRYLLRHVWNWSRWFGCSMCGTRPIGPRSGKIDGTFWVVRAWGRIHAYLAPAPWIKDGDLFAHVLCAWLWEFFFEYTRRVPNGRCGRRSTKTTNFKQCVRIKYKLEIYVEKL